MNSTDNNEPSDTIDEEPEVFTPNNSTNLPIQDGFINNLVLQEMKTADTLKETPGRKDNNPALTAHHLHEVKGEATKEYIYGYNPMQIRKAYGFNNKYTGKGQTIAIVCAFNYPTLKHDLDVFSRQFHLPPADVKIVYASGTVPPTDAGWAMETALDVQWAHALAPEAKILAVLAASNTFVDLFQAVDVATQAGANVVSMSWGGAEFSGESQWDVHLNHPGTAYVAGSGDVGGNTIYPSVSPYVLSAGGTHINIDEHGNRYGAGEWAWVNGGGGPSLFIPIPSWQSKFKGVADKTGAYRATPDVAFDSDMASGVAIYDSTPYNDIVGWTLIGGTSLAAPCWAGIIACMGQHRKRIKNINELLYKIAGETDYTFPQKYYTDITIGSAGTYQALPGWDFCTGLGSPIVSRLCERTHRFSPFAWVKKILGLVKK